jgi:thioredoxin reductase
MRRGDVMIGPGGKAVRPLSESDALTKAIRLIHDGDTLSAVELLNRLRRQVSGGYHQNPYTPFRVVGVIGKDVHSVAYRHAKDNKLYKHDFQRDNAQVLAVERHGKKELLITGDVPLWDEFD